jgi:hypothetical protein
MQGQRGDTDADVIGLAAIGSDQVNLVKQAGAFRLAGGKQALASFLVYKALRSLPLENFGRLTTVSGDGRVINDLTQYHVKSPASRRGSWDYYEEVGTLPAVEAFPPINPVCEHAS